MSDPAFQRMSVEEYLRTEPDSPVKREYVNGFVYVLDQGDGARAQAGASKGHVTITGNVHHALYGPCRRAHRRLYASDMKVRIEPEGSFYYPDVMVACGPDNGEPYFESSPCLLVEVLSRRTAATDRHAKYAAYTSPPSLRTYLIVAQEERRVYAYHREDSEWVLTEYAGQGVIPLPCPQTELPLDEIYAGVQDA
ncbi:Uma2 family endonuclease [Deinococcus sp. NW-56]|uniref:Uma2 family endonuclease n=1 Tax=Deinococcus sp. NW-56 TaxID=2080419 RepID=UPI000CF482F6|nr:Uma2 family endonuclease [Deinococcus sp. NW-56]